MQPKPGVEIQPRRRRVSMAHIVIAVPALLLVLSPVLFYANFKTIRRWQFDRQEALRRSLIAPLPSSITELQGTGDTWQGLSYFLRFRASLPELEEHLAAHGFEQMDPTASHAEHDPEDQCLNLQIFIQTHQPPSDMANYFDPPWDAKFGGKSRYWVKQHANGGTSEVLVNPTSPWVYLWAGSGSSNGLDGN